MVQLPGQVELAGEVKLPDLDKEAAARRKAKHAPPTDPTAIPMDMHRPEDVTNETVWCVRCLELHRINTSAMINTQTAKDAEGNGHQIVKVPSCHVCRRNRGRFDAETHGKW